MSPAEPRHPRLALRLPAVLAGALLLAVLGGAAGLLLGQLSVSGHDDVSFVFPIFFGLAGGAAGALGGAVAGWILSGQRRP